MSKVLPELFTYACFGKTEAVIFIQLDFISRNYALCLNCFSHFTKLILRKSKRLLGFSFGRQAIKVSLTLSMLLFTLADDYPLSLHIT